MAKLSLQEQMLKAGLVDKKKAKKVGKTNKKSRTLAKEVKAAAEQVKIEQQQRDAELAQQQNAEKAKKAVAAQIKQLIEMNMIDRKRGDEGYNFTHNGVIKKIFVTEELRKQLSNGRLAIVTLGEAYQVVPTIVAEKVAQRDENVVVLINDPSQDVIDEDDPYADYQVPDDLMW
ncbi:MULTISPECIES: DUF2058 domain-containing protein [unclassified Agarivorans]|uniref:DUF2058 domain-containing protein n=1 Tax=unclassified Agarivorans TaxID=2636026 RepID=UPI003D7D0CDC